MNPKELYQYWRKLSDEKWKTAKSLMETKRYADALFFCDLVVEAELKGLVVLHTKKQSPYTHDLVHLAVIADLTCDVKQQEILNEMNTFNIRARYVDYKSAFHKKANKAFAETYFTESKKLRTWIRKQAKNT